MFAKKRPSSYQAEDQEEQSVGLGNRGSRYASSGAIRKRRKDDIKRGAGSDIEPVKGYGCGKGAAGAVLGVLANRSAESCDRAARAREAAIRLAVYELVGGQVATKHKREGRNRGPGVVDDLIDRRGLRANHCLKDDTPVLNTRQTEWDTTCALQTARSVAANGPSRRSTGTNRGISDGDVIRTRMRRKQKYAQNC